MSNALHTEDSLTIFRDRLEQLRAQHAQTIEQACEYIEKESGIKVTRRTYTYWINEHTDKDGMRKYRAPSIENLLAIAKAYEVSTDFLLGLSDYTSAERDCIGKETGLSDKAIKHLQRIRTSEPHETVSCIDWIMSNSFILDIAERLIQLIRCGKNDIFVFTDPNINAGKPFKITEYNYYALKNSPSPPAFTKEPLDGHSMGFTPELQEQTTLNKINDLFKRMRNVWNAENEHRDK